MAMTFLEISSLRQLTFTKLGNHYVESNVTYSRTEINAFQISKGAFFFLSFRLEGLCFYFFG